MTADGGLSTVAAVWLIARREIVTRAASRVFKVTTVLLVVGVVALTVLSAVLSGTSSATSVALTPETQPLEAPLRASAAAVGADLTYRQINPADAEAQVRAGEVDAVLLGSVREPQVLVEEQPAPELAAALRLLAQQLALDGEVRRLGGDPTRVAERVATAEVAVAALEPPDPQQGERIALALVVGILIYVTLLTYGQTVAQGVVEEKTSRVVELLLATVRPWQLMAGKVVGIGLISLAQLALVGVVGVVAARVSGVLTIGLSATAGAVAWAVVWYLLGFLVYSLMFAAAGALVSRQEDVGSVTVPILLLIIAPYVVAASVLPSDPRNALVAWLSIVPLFAPMLMPWRIALDVASAWEVGLSVALTLALVPVLVWLAARIYTGAVVRTGARVGLLEALRSG